MDKRTEVLRKQLADDCLPGSASGERQGPLSSLSAIPASGAHAGKQLFGLDHQRQQLFELLRRTVAVKESNSVLLVGPRGTGKSSVTRLVLRDLAASFGPLAFSLVQLNGFVQTDDRIALREIAAQLRVQRDMDGGSTTSFAATLAFILEALRAGSRETTPIVFVLDEFDQFAAHTKQTLLYNLFDVCQSAQTPIAVVGISCRLDVVEMLEKRVKSRFSHRQIHFFHTFGFDEYRKMAENALTLPPSGPENATGDWNRQVPQVLGSERLKSALRAQFDMNKDPRLLQTVLTPAVSTLHPRLSGEAIVDTINSQSVDAKALILQGLSTLELCLMIAMHHVQSKLEPLQPFNFEMVYDEYKQFAASNTNMVDFFSKPVSLKAFEHLLALELVRPVHAAVSHTPKEFRFVKLMVEPSQIVEAVMRFPDCSSAVKRWGTHWIE